MSDFPTTNDPFQSPQFGGEPEQPDKEYAKRKLAGPAWAIIILCALSLVWVLLSAVFASSIQDAIYDAVINAMPDEDSREEVRKQIEEQKNSPFNLLSD